MNDDALTDATLSELLATFPGPSKEQDITMVLGTPWGPVALSQSKSMCQTDGSDIPEEIRENVFAHVLARLESPTPPQP